MGRKRDKPFYVGDPVHGYLRVAEHERLVVDHPITPRLRRVGQTGLAHMVYPEAATSRFIHSLGAMHLASRFVVSALENATSDVASAVFSELETIAGEVGLKKLELLDPLIGGESERDTGLLSARAIIRGAGSPAERQKRRRLLGLAEAATRLAALFHDLGHLPFSHDLEFALKERFPDKDARPKLNPIVQTEAPHEEIGHLLADLLFETELPPDRPDIRACYEFARRILGATWSFDSIARTLAWLHSLVDGEIDVDRADYLLRDGRALGFEFATYDIERLISSLEVAENDRKGLMTVVAERGLPALESFLVTRARSHQFMVRHHKVAQFGVALRYASRKAFDTKRGEFFLRALERLGSKTIAPSERKTFLRTYARFDDAWWFETMRRMKRGSDPLLTASLNLIIHREQTLKSLWKRRGQIEDRREALSDAAADVSAFERKRADLLKDGVLVHRHVFRPYRLKPGADKNPDTRQSVLAVRTRPETPKGSSDGKLQPAAKLSPLINALWAAWKEDVHVHAFALKSSEWDAEQVIKRLIE